MDTISDNTACDRPPAAVRLSPEDDKGMQETAYLLRSPANARRLLESIAQLEHGQGHTHTQAGQDLFPFCP